MRPARQEWAGRAAAAWEERLFAFVGLTGAADGNDVEGFAFDSHVAGFLERRRINETQHAFQRIRTTILSPATATRGLGSLQ